MSPIPVESLAAPTAADLAPDHARIGAGATLREALACMAAAGVDRVTVEDDSGAALGVLTADAIMLTKNG